MATRLPCAMIRAQGHKVSGPDGHLCRHGDTCARSTDQRRPRERPTRQGAVFTSEATAESTGAHLVPLRVQT